MTSDISQTNIQKYISFCCIYWSLWIKFIHNYQLVSCKIIYVEGIDITSYDPSSDRRLSVSNVLNVVLIRNLECATSPYERQKGNLPKRFQWFIFKMCYSVILVKILKYIIYQKTFCCAVGKVHFTDFI